MTEQNTPQTPPEEVPVVAPALPYTIHANLHEFRHRAKAPFVIAAILAVIFGARFGVVGLISLLVGIALIIGVVLWILSHRSVTITNEGLEYKIPLFKVRKVAFSDVEGVKVFMNYVDGLYGGLPRISIAVKGVKKPVTLYALYWSLEDLEKVLAILKDKKLATEYYPDPANAAMIAKQFPAYVSLIERHPWWIAWATIIGIVIIVTVVVIALQ